MPCPTRCVWPSMPTSSRRIAPIIVRRFSKSATRPSPSPRSRNTSVHCVKPASSVASAVAWRCTTPRVAQSSSSASPPDRGNRQCPRDPIKGRSSSEETRCEKIPQTVGDQVKKRSWNDQWERAALHSFDVPPSNSIHLQCAMMECEIISARQLRLRGLLSNTSIEAIAGLTGDEYVLQQRQLRSICSST